MTAPSGQKVSSVNRLRLMDALRRRVYPATMLHRKQLSAAIGFHGDTLDRVLRGDGSPSFDLTCSLVQFFKSRGDVTFAYEVLGIAAPSSAPVAEAVAALDRAKRLLENAA